MGTYKICPNCKEERRFSYADGGLEYNPVWWCDNCGFETNDIDKLKDYEEDEFKELIEEKLEIIRG